MILKLAAEDFARCYGILILDDDFLVEIDHSLIPENLMKELKHWYSSYYKYTGMSIKELKSHISSINALDDIGVQLLKDIYISKIFDGITKYVYYSRGKDKVLLKLDPILPPAGS